MKTKNLVANLVVLLGFVFSFSFTAHADNTVCAGAVFLTPDGSSVTQTFTAGGQSRFFRFEMMANRSYMLLVENLSPTDIDNIINMSFPLDACGGAALPNVADRSGTEPSGFDGTVGNGRITILSATNDTKAFFSVTGSNVSFRVRVEETTLFNTAWSTFGTFETFYSCINATANQTLNATLKIFNTAGAEVGSFAFNNIPAGGTVSTNTGTLGVANNLNGSATLTHNGTPGGILCEAAIADFATAPRVIQPVKFQRRNTN